jgi:hypothetical protein
MNEIDFETRLISLTKGMEYPRTPDIAGSVRTRLRAFPSPIGRGARGEVRPRFISRKLAWSLTIILVLLSSLLLIPPVRAAIIEFIQIGVVRIFPRTVEPTAQAIATATPESLAPMTATSSAPTSALLRQLNQIAGKTTLADAQARAGFDILLPTYPRDLRQPDYVFLQDVNGNMAVLVWLDPQNPDKVLMSLHFVPAQSWIIMKYEPKVIQETKVNGQRAIWTEGPYPLLLRNGDVNSQRLVTGHVLIWTEGDLTYRLETDQPLEEAVKIAESLSQFHNSYRPNLFPIPRRTNEPSLEEFYVNFLKSI